MAQTMELSLDVQSPIQTLQEKSLKRHHAHPLPLLAQLILLRGAATLFKSKSLKQRRVKR